MAKYHHIRRKIRSIRNTRQITKAMEMVSASKLRRAQDRLRATRPYQEKLQEMLKLVSAFREQVSHPLLEGREVKTRGLIVLGTERGLCGAYNTNLLRLAQNWIDSGSTPVRVVAIGRRTQAYFRRKPGLLQAYYPQPHQDLNLVEIRPLANALMQLYLSGEVDSIHLVFARFRSALVNIPTVVQLVPFEPPEEEESDTREYIFEPEPHEILEHLLPRAIMMSLVGYLAESFTSEHGARMVAMQNATKNAGEMIDRLTLQFNRERQASITQEILEVVSGANAL